MSSMNKDDEEFKDFLDGLDNTSFDVKPKKTEVMELPPISEDEFEEKLMSGVAMLLESCNAVATELKSRIESGDNYEGTMMGFAQATDNTIKTLKFLETRRNLKLREQIDHKKMKQSHEYKIAEQEKKNEGKALTGNNLTQNNTFVGSPVEFFEQMKKMERVQKGKAIDIQ